MRISFSRSPRDSQRQYSPDNSSQPCISGMTKDAWSTGFEVAVGILENGVCESRRKADFFENENKMLVYRQDYEHNALNEILHERTNAIFDLQECNDKVHEKYNKDQAFQIQRIQEEQERKLDVIRQNQEDGKESLFHLIYQTEQALEERYNIIYETERQFKLQVKQMKCRIGELKLTLEDIKKTNKSNDEKIMNIINANNQHENELAETIDQFERTKLNADKIK